MTRNEILGCCLALATLACGRTPMDGAVASATDASTSYPHPRQPYFTPSSESYAYYEGTAVANGCQRDQDCQVSGCMRSTCAASALELSDDNGFCRSRMTVQWPEPQLAECGCLAGDCRWYFESDYDRVCDRDTDCAGLGLPVTRSGVKGPRWQCIQGTCQYLDR